LKIVENLVRPMGDSLKEFNAFDTTLPIEDCLFQYEHELVNIPDRTFELIILGIGEDGHIASLFPHSEALLEEKRLVAHTTTDNFSVGDRLTMTLPVILKSKAILVLLQGMEKQKVLNKLDDETLSIQEFPARALVDHPNVTIHFCSC
ncbi:MAG: 6-phosphogluconolactonase, partial [Candidatus Peregrinibacteria bacterium]|nr:6-phosphogluconolactonase [Candidatus Peregrinibacteria bacterium]